MILYISDIHKSYLKAKIKKKKKDQMNDVTDYPDW